MESSKYIERYQENILTNREDEDENDLLQELEDELDNDGFISSYREQRIQELSNQIKTINSKDFSHIDEEHGNVKTITEEKDVIEETLRSDITIIHFYGENFKTCKILDKNLVKLSLKHLNVSFLRIDASKAPFLVVKLKIKILPCLVVYRKQVEVFRLVGFEHLTTYNGTTFKIEELEELLYRNGALDRKSIKFNNLRNKIKNDKNHYDEEDSDLDL
ncbi:hypothetical protein PACTADRAFT_47734 [Pachysolen tannophilus NRRL Y-2460]|uniref:Phosducin domain-containing protein n=1 Tax=Pachysolen tannophilus NRRL Y-2460 TaxID=669874 RepID=A0A1E4U1X8_PACTA|nr:hypothetical protein PACTADRAFT_47734 [Pachysolen tannophilus NRRL Y-2460]